LATNHGAGPCLKEPVVSAIILTQTQTKTSRLKVVTIFGTRPEIIKLSRVIAALDRHTEHILVHSGQNYDYELNGIFFDQLEIRRPDHFLEAVGETAAETIGAVIAKSDKLLRQLKPDAVLFYGDTNTCLAVVSAKRLKIPVFHMEAGNRCFDQRVPEEINRKVVDHLSDINMTLTEHARRYLIAEGIRPETVIKTGSSMREVLTYYAPGIEASTALRDLELQPQDYFVVSAHREENVDVPENLRSMLQSIQALHDSYGKQVIVSTHPRTRKQLESYDLSAFPGVRFMKPLGFLDYVHLQQHAFCVVSDSGTLTEESSLLGFPAVMIRDSHERPEGMDVATLVMSGLQTQRVLDSVRVVTEQAAASAAAGQRETMVVPDYDVPNVSDKVVRLILSYTQYVNRTVWSREPFDAAG
jgi:UDP-N-acetylglucosamine 2-epimerase (non-hydrolysing)